MPFENRAEAARLLVKRLGKYRALNPVVLAIPRGGAVPVGKIVAEALDGELDVVLVRKLRAPFNPRARDRVDRRNRFGLPRSGHARSMGSEVPRCGTARGIRGVATPPAAVRGRGRTHRTLSLIGGADSRRK